MLACSEEFTESVAVGSLSDEALENEEQAISRYDITSYGIDFDVEGLVKRVRRGDIFIPSFQRKYT